MRLRPSETAPDANEQILIYESMLGAWPIARDRLKQYMTKALREAKTHTSWIAINEDYESRVMSFLDSLYASRKFQADFDRLQKKIAYFGALSSLSQLVLKATSPGLPDFYRGTELWDLSLADPDNRRDVDFSRRLEMLDDLRHTGGTGDLLKHWEDGRVKMYVTWKLLQFRREHADLFSQGEYIPLSVTGTHADHVIAFARHLHGQWCVVAVPRLCASITRAGSPPLGKKIWKTTQIEPPRGASKSWTNILTGEDVRLPFFASNLFSRLPVSVIAADRPESSSESRLRTQERSRQTTASSN
jgi:(1->4)-alpha-D-glucan 1-alpha-D-glucosylmutase